MLLFGSEQSESSVLQVGPASTPSPDTYTHPKSFRSTLFPHRRKSNSRRMYLHAPHSPPAFHTLHDGYRHRGHVKPKKRGHSPLSFPFAAFSARKERKERGRMTAETEGTKKKTKCLLETREEIKQFRSIFIIGVPWEGK